MNCTNCNSSPVHGPATILHRINPKGVVGEWLCDMCLKSAEISKGKIFYIHTPICDGYCIYTCNIDRGFDLAEHAENNLESNQ